MSTDDKQRGEIDKEGEERAVLLGQEVPANVGMDRFAEIFEASAKRWELVVYPSLVAFIILAVYGFYLVYSLTSDVAQLARSVDPSMEHHMSEMTNSIREMSEAVRAMSNTVHEMDGTLKSISGDVKTLGPMLTQIEQLNRSALSMAGATSQMGHDISVMNRNVSPAMRSMGSFMPW
jgi:methyl-accepting chemotaxis protein